MSPRLDPLCDQAQVDRVSVHERTLLLTVAGDTLALRLEDSPVRILILNGSSVVKQFEDIAGVSLERREMRSWSLPRQSQPDVAGFAYKGMIDVVSGIGLGHTMLVLGFNHNLQSSFGVTTEVMHAIRGWITRAANEMIQ